MPKTVPRTVSPKVGRHSRRGWASGMTVGARTRPSPARASAAATTAPMRVLPVPRDSTWVRAVAVGEGLESLPDRFELMRPRRPAHGADNGRRPARIAVSPKSGGVQCLLHFWCHCPANLICHVCDVPRHAAEIAFGVGQDG